MDKVKKFLESYVEWLAVALAAVFLGWITYSYVLQKPVTVMVGTETGVAPADINKKIWDDPGEKLDQALKQTTPPPPMGPTVDYPTEIVNSFSKESPGIKDVLVTPWTPMAPVIDTELVPANNSNVVAAGSLAVLPIVPTPTNLASGAGHSNIQPPNPGGDAAAAAPAGAMVAIDKNWITFGGSIPVAALAKSLVDAKIPNSINNVAIYRVIVVRQEKDAAGAWGKDTELQPLDINPLMPLPPVNCNFQDRQDYKTFAETQTNVVLIAEPPFYTVLQGDVWYEPGAKNPNDNNAQAVVELFDSRDPLAFKGDPTTLLPDEKKIYDDAKTKKDLQDQRRNRSNTPQPGGLSPGGLPPGFPGAPGAPGAPGGTNGRGGGIGRGGGGGGGGGRNAMPEPQPQNPGNLLQPRPDRGAPFNPYGQGMRPPEMSPGMDNGGGQASSVASLPQGSFSPADRVAAATAAPGTDPNIKIWAHDTTVLAGKTYRYKIKYVISNPLAGTTNTCQNPDDATKAWIESEFSPWSDPINVESDTSFYAHDNQHGIRFDIFKWNKGLWQEQTVQANPGDRIGSVDNTPNHTDFDTGWTLVDVREDPNGNTENKILILVSDNGIIKQKEISTDRQNTQYRKLMLEWMSTRDKTAQASGGPGGPPGALPVR